MSSLGRTAYSKQRRGDGYGGMYSIMTCQYMHSDSHSLTRAESSWLVSLEIRFISDCMGHPPLIADNSFTTKLPADVDEEASWNELVRTGV